MRRLVGLLLIVLFAARSLLPAGFMLETATGDDLIHVVICTGSGAKTVTLDADGEPVPAKPASSENGTCAFAAAVYAGLVGDGAPVVSVGLHYAAVAYATPERPHMAAINAGSASARGPPAIG